MEPLFLLDELVICFYDDEYLELWDCEERKTIYKGRRGDLAKFLRANNCHYYWYYNVVSIESLAGDTRGLSISIQKRR